MPIRRNADKKNNFIFYASYIFCVLVFASLIFTFTTIFGTSFPLAALLIIASVTAICCVCHANRLAAKKPVQSNLERKVQNLYGLIFAFSFAAVCALSFLPKPLWFCVAAIFMLVLCAAGTNRMAIISITIEIIIIVCFHTMGLQMLLSLFVLVSAIAVFFDKHKENLDGKLITIVILILQPTMAYVGNYPIAESDRMDFIAMLIVCEVISYIFILFEIRFVGKNIAYWLKDKYLLLNDQTYGLLQELKARCPDKYQECLHGVYFTERAAKAAGIDAGLANAGMYYFHLDVLTKENADDEIIRIALKHDFPEAMTKLLLECRHYPNRPRSPEATVVMITLVTIRFALKWFEKNGNKKFNAQEVIAPMCETIYNNGYLSESKLSSCDWIKLKNVLINGGAYYELIMRK